MATIAEIRAGLAANLTTIDGFQVEATGAYMLGAPTPPSIEAFPEESEYDLTMQRGTDGRNWTVRAFVGLATDIAAQKKLDLLLAPSGPMSVKAAVEADRTLGGVIDDLRVTRDTGYRLYQPTPQIQVLGCEWTVEITD
jgi:hypothetical protein